MIEKLLEYVPMLLGWIKQFMNHAPMPGKGEIEFRRYPASCDLNYIYSEATGPQIVRKITNG